MYKPINYTITTEWYEISKDYTHWCFHYIKNDEDNRKEHIFNMVIKDDTEYYNIFYSTNLSGQYVESFSLHLLNESCPLSLIKSSFRTIPIEVLQSISLRILDVQLAGCLGGFNTKTNYLSNSIGNLAFLNSDKFNKDNYELSKQLIIGQKIDIKELIEYLPMTKGIRMYTKEHSIHSTIKELYETSIRNDKYTFDIISNIYYYQEVDYIVIEWELCIFINNGWELYKGTIEELYNILLNNFN